jgi:hypothetical protein
MLKMECENVDEEDPLFLTTIFPTGNKPDHQEHGLHPNLPLLTSIPDLKAVCIFWYIYAMKPYLQGSLCGVAHLSALYHIQHCSVLHLEILPYGCI